MARKKKIEDVVKAKKVVKVKPITKAKTTTSKAPAIAKCGSLDDITVDQLDALLNNTEQAQKIIQLINDYSFEADQQERIRCVSIAFGNWRHGAKFDPTLGTKDNYEQHNFNKCKTILEEILT